MNTQADCYGKMFPSVIEMAHNKPVAGRVFGYQVDYTGLVAHKRDAMVDRDAWQLCLKCPDFATCYQLSTATILMELAVKTTPQSLY